MSGASDLANAGPLVWAAQSLQARLKLGFPESKFQHAFIPARLTPKEWLRLVTRTPFIGLGWAGVAPDKENARVFRGEARFVLMLVAKNTLRDGRYFGDAQGPGLFGMVQVAALLLQGFTPSLPDFDWEAAGSANVHLIDNLYADEWGDDNAAVAGMEVHMPIELEMPADLAVALDGSEPGWFTTEGITWSFDTPETTAGQLAEPYTVGT